MEIKVGDYVKSYDFPSQRDLVIRELCYVEGVVMRVGDDIEGCPRYVIRVTKQVFNGNVITDKHVPEYVNPPVNGTPSLFGGVCDGVVKIEGSV